MKYTKESIVEGLMVKIDSLNESLGLKNAWKKMIVKYPTEIEQNVLEWINDEPLSDIDCHGESIVQTMKTWNFSQNDIPAILCGFVMFKESGSRVSNHIWQAVMGEQCVYDGKID